VCSGKSGEENQAPKSEVVIRSNMKKLYQMVSYCENNVECRRVQLLDHFGEHFDRADCQSGCDNCANPAAAASRDVTADAQAIIRIAQSMISRDGKCRHNVLSEVFRGSKGKAGAGFSESVTQH
jgi:superfamily II DNA helicase RecQ